MNLNRPRTPGLSGEIKPAYQSPSRAMTPTQPQRYSNYSEQGHQRETPSHNRSNPFTRTPITSPSATVALHNRPISTPTSLSRSPSISSLSTPVRRSLTTQHHLTKPQYLMKPQPNIRPLNY
ncbi:hypothetical protein WA158_006081 [Blastocystis sp. Blastoise]